MEKVQRKTCFCTAAEDEQELYTQQELLALHSWSPEDHTRETETGPGLLVGRAAPVIQLQQPDLQKGRRGGKRLRVINYTAEKN